MSFAVSTGIITVGRGGIEVPEMRWIEVSLTNWLDTAQYFELYVGYTPGSRACQGAYFSPPFSTPPPPHHRFDTDLFQTDAAGEYSFIGAGTNVPWDAANQGPVTIRCELEVNGTLRNLLNGAMIEETIVSSPNFGPHVGMLTRWYVTGTPASNMSLRALSASGSPGWSDDFERASMGADWALMSPCPDNGVSAQPFTIESGAAVGPMDHLALPHNNAAMYHV